MITSSFHAAPAHRRPAQAAGERQHRPPATGAASRSISLLAFAPPPAPPAGDARGAAVPARDLLPTGADETRAARQAVWRAPPDDPDPADLHKRLQVQRLMLPLYLKGQCILLQPFGPTATLRLGARCTLPSWIVEGAVGALAGAGLAGLRGWLAPDREDAAFERATFTVLGSLGTMVAAGLLRQGRDVYHYLQEVKQAKAQLALLDPPQAPTGSGRSRC